jgi:hypothetical protein
MKITNAEKVPGGEKYTGPCEKCDKPYSFVMPTTATDSVDMTCPHCRTVPRELVAELAVPSDSPGLNACKECGGVRKRSGKKRPGEVVTGLGDVTATFLKVEYICAQCHDRTWGDEPA